MGGRVLWLIWVRSWRSSLRKLTELSGWSAVRYWSHDYLSYQDDIDDTMMATRAYILIVEDERLVAKDLERRLTRMDYVVVAIAATGPDAIHQALEHRPDLVLMDIRLQGEMDGITAAAFIRTHLNIPVIYLSAYVDEMTLERAQDTAPAGFLRKPFNEYDLRQTLQQVLSL
jgi:CheY-like chemotaxis protein